MLINIIVIAALILSLIVNTLSLFYILKLRDTCKDMRDVENVLIECATTNAAATKDLYDSYMEIVEREDLVADGCNKLVEEYKAITENDRKLVHTLEKLARELVKEYRAVESRYSDVYDMFEKLKDDISEADRKPIYCDSCLVKTILEASGQSIFDETNEEKVPA